MQNEINFLHKPEGTEKVKLSSNVKVIRFFAFVLIILTPTSAIILFLLILFSPVPHLQQEENSLLAQSQSVQKKAAQVQFIANRMSQAKIFMSKQDKYDQVVNTFTQLLTPDVTVSTIAITDGQLNLEVQSNSLLSLQNYQSALSNVDNDYISHLAFQQLGFSSDDNVYSLTISMQAK